MQEVLKFRPLYQERVWGGRGFERWLGRPLPAERPIGESWEIVDRAEAQSLIEGGAWHGKTLREAIATNGETIMGPRWPRDRRFPILVKWLDCRERLSLQVHPPASLAAELGGEPKTENWFIARAEPGASLIVGLRKGVTRDHFERALREQRLENCVHRFEVRSGDSILVRSGQVHAIDGGNLILEIQQNSDTTYRVYDWGRMGLDGKPRAMHVEESLRSIAWDNFEPMPRKGAATADIIADAPEFRIRRMPLARGETLAIGAHEQPRILSVVSGEVRTGENSVPLRTGENAVLPFAGEFVFRSATDTVLLLTENFC